MSTPEQMANYGDEAFRQNWRKRMERAEAQVERLSEAIDRARMERAQAEDAETEATARAERAEAAVLALDAECHRLRIAALDGLLAVEKAGRCACGHTKASHPVGECVGCTGPECR